MPLKSSLFLNVYSCAIYIGVCMFRGRWLVAEAGGGISEHQHPPSTPGFSSAWTMLGGGQTRVPLSCLLIGLTRNRTVSQRIVVDRCMRSRWKARSKWRHVRLFDLPIGL